jgi:predicted  nucleic acid-binding Zn-ribbon protein
MTEDNLAQALVHIGKALDRLEEKYETITTLKLQVASLMQDIKNLEEYIKTQEY